MNTTPPSLLAELQQRVSDLLRNSPAADIERNLKAMLTQTFQRIELVTRDEFDRETERVLHLQERIEALERRLAQAGIGADGTMAGATASEPATATATAADTPGPTANDDGAASSGTAPAAEPASPECPSPSSTAGD